MRRLLHAFLMVLTIICLDLTDSYGQSLEFTKIPSGPVNFDLEVDVAKINLHVKNTSSAPVKVWVTMDTSKLFPAHRAYFCWEQCYSFGVVDARNIAGGKPLTLKPGQDTSAFTAYVDHYAVYNEPRAGTSTLVFDFFNEEDPSDRITATLVFNVGTTTSVTDSDQYNTGLVSWNPSSRQFIMPNTSNIAGLDLYSMNGTLMKNVHTSNLNIPNGVYGYILHTVAGTQSRGIISIY